MKFNGGDIIAGRNITIIGNRIIVDGNEIEGSFSGKVELHILEGVVENIKADGSINALDVSGSINAGGSVNCDAVTGDVSAGGSVNCDDVGGSVRAGGSVNCDDIGGSVTATVVKRG